jgi:lipoprotein-releasing system permease protein
MYKLQLIRKYLFKRRIAWVALVAVMLCTAMVLVVVSVMGGWLRNFKQSFHGMTGDVVITASSLGGFPNYQEMIDSIVKLKDVQSAVPIIRTGGLINIDNRDVEMVQVLGYPTDIGKVNDWPSSLHLNPDDRKQKLREATTRPNLTAAERHQLDVDMSRLPFGLHPDLYRAYERTAEGKPAPNRLNRPGMIVSTLVVGMRKDKGPDADDFRREFYRMPVTLTLVPVVGGEAISLDSVQPIPFWIVDDSHSRLYALDNNNVYISFEEAQKDLRMTATADQDARCSEVEIKAVPGADLNTLRDQVAAITEQVRLNHAIPYFYEFKVETWLQQQGVFIKAVENEVLITTTLFSVISMVAVLLIFCIFYMIVIEKTKDIGIIKSLGATGWGILSLFLGYGFAIGAVGAALGFAAAFFFMRYINDLHAWLARITGRDLFSPETYQFDKLPDRMETQTVVIVVIAAVISALVGALIPALRAAMMNPVEALRYE